jgi:hypothetical protein
MRLGVCAPHPVEVLVSMRTTITRLSLFLSVLQISLGHNDVGKFDAVRGLDTPSCFHNTSADRMSMEAVSLENKN